MDILLIELSPNNISIDKNLFPDRDEELLIYKHLKHYCSKFYPLPTIEVKVCTESVIVIRGHSYLTIAQDLGHQRIQAIIDKNSSKAAVFNLLQESSVKQLDWKLKVKENDDNLFEYIWLIFFFERILKQEEKKILEEQVIEFYRQIEILTWAEVPENRIKNLSYPYLGYCVEFQACVPVEDERWYAKSKAVLANFHLNHVPIVSFQGYKFLMER